MKQDHEEEVIARLSIASPSTRSNELHDDDQPTSSSTTKPLKKGKSPSGKDPRPPHSK